MFLHIFFCKIIFLYCTCMSYSQIFKKELERDFIIDYIKNNLHLVKNKNSSSSQSIDISNEVIHTYDTSYNGSKLIKDIYLLNKVVYKKIKFHDNISKLTTYLKKKYYQSKVNKYITDNMSYKKFVTIFRQCCKYLKINIDSKIVYSNSTYEMTYYVSF